MAEAKDLIKLKGPFPPSQIHWRIGATTQDKKRGLALAYLDKTAIERRLDDAVEQWGWQCRFPHIGDKTCCEIGIWVQADDGTGMWIWKSDGAGDTEYEANKGAFTDAFKRAAAKWGIGQYLYELDAPWADVEQRGKSYVPTSDWMPKLDRIVLKANAEFSKKLHGDEVVQHEEKDPLEEILGGALGPVSEIKVPTVDGQEDWHTWYNKLLVPALRSCKTSDEFTELIRANDQTLGYFMNEHPDIKDRVNTQLDRIEAKIGEQHV